MTYAEKLAEEIRMEFLSQKLDFSTALQKAITQAMQAQREACAKAGKSVVLNYSTLTLAKSVQQAILNAEVKP